MKQILPLLYNVINSCIYTLNVSKPEPVQSWGFAALIDCLTALDGLVSVLTTETIVKELLEVQLFDYIFLHRLKRYSKQSEFLLIQDRNCPYVKILMHKDIGIQVHQVLLICTTPKVVIVLKFAY